MLFPPLRTDCRNIIDKRIKPDVNLLILVFRHRGAVYRYARFVAAGASDAEDVLQETFLAAWRGAGGFAGRSSVRT